MKLPVTKWNYIHMPGVDFIGPMAQDFYASFKLGGTDSTHIISSASGNIALVAIKALGTQANDLKGKNDALQNQVQSLNSQNQSLQNQISTQQSQIDELRQSLQQVKDMQIQCCNLQQGNNSNTTTPLGLPRLDQNVPNPFTQNTVIGYYLPENISSAIINVQSLDGKVLMHFDIRSHGNGQILISGGALQPGTYVYNMLIDSNQIDSKKMVLIGQ